ncbi:helix-turn-helix domain-containing protein [Erwinia mallotivora]|uniref:helix-turn-helix domain-containing protein n=1 Tax=Erwinia mallotivora TaxID=69222 RepID=UPI000A05304F|nr:helix-turn-helix domain-containing protein [Erwinia mallotivora]
MQKDFSEKLGIAKSHVASLLQREQVSSNAIVQCALNTGGDVNWLVTGKGMQRNDD